MLSKLLYPLVVHSRTGSSTSVTSSVGCTVGNIFSAAMPVHQKDINIAFYESFAYYIYIIIIIVNGVLKLTL